MIENHKNLFPNDVPKKQWVRFPAEGFGREIVGLVYQSGQAICGLPLGGIGTGHVHLDTDGTLGFCTIFNSVMPPRKLEALPFLGVTCRDHVWLLTTKDVEGASKVSDIHYWGHYPVADLLYQMESLVSVSLRAWSPFLPGNAEASNTPAIVFEVRLSNQSTSREKGVLAITFSGPNEGEVDNKEVTRKEIYQENKTGIAIDVAGKGGYFLGLVGEEQVRIGGDLNKSANAWCRVVEQLPKCGVSDVGTSVAVDFDLNPGQNKTVRFVLSWYWPLVTVNGRHRYVHAYASRFCDALAVADMVANKHDSLLEHIIAWQEVIYGEESLPEWLRDCLVNNFHLITKNAFWESNSVPAEDWAQEYGMFSMVESIRTCAGQGCVPSDWFGNIEVVYFFSKLAHSALKGLAHFQLPNGEIPIYLGEGHERQNPVYQVLHVTNSCNFVDLVGRLWQRTGNDTVLYEFYPSVKLAVEYLRSLDTDADGLIDCQVGALYHQFYGLWCWFGAATHVAGMWLSSLSIAERMARKIGDMSFVRDCQVWSKLGRKSMQDKLWNGSYYLLYNDVENNRKDDTILANQLSGLWSSRLHGVEDPFPTECVEKVFKKVKNVCFPAAKYGVAVARHPDGSVNNNGAHQSTDVFLGEIMVLAVTMIYAGDREVGIEIARQLMDAIVLLNGRAWDMPGFLNNDTGEASFGHDFDQLMALWALPAAIANQTISESVAEGTLVDRIIKAACS